MISTIQRAIGCISFWMIALGIFTSPVIYWAFLNFLGPSTEYHDPYIEGAQRLPSGKYVAVLGEKVFIRYTIVRHQINGNCLLHIHRYGDYIGGPWNGQRVLIDYADLRFSGQNELRHPRWPLDGWVLGQTHTTKHAVLPDKPLIPADSQSQELALYVVARYYCNPLDYLFPRYVTGGSAPNESERVNLIVRRTKS